MCGRFFLTTPPGPLATLFDLDDVPDLTPRYNVAPTQPVAIIRPSGEGRRELREARWGLLPSWSAGPEKAYHGINARAETVATLPSFRDAFRSRRCLIPADGFYEWKAEGKQKRPHAIRWNDHRPFAFAGLWEVWNGQGGALETAAILTTTANDLLRPLHPRMPVILPPEAWAAWLDHDVHDRTVLEALLVPVPDDRLVVTAVGPWVNSARHEGPRCLEPAAPQASLF
jgi:putative SOS response-associated peptidase YedK